jgi:hypothetical protein
MASTAQVEYKKFPAETSAQLHSASEAGEIGSFAAASLLPAVVGEHAHGQGHLVSIAEAVGWGGMLCSMAARTCRSGKDRGLEEVPTDSGESWRRSGARTGS